MLAQQSRACVSFAKGLVWIPSTTLWLTIVCNFSPRGSAFFVPLGAPDTHEVHTHMVKQSTHKHKIIKQIWKNNINVVGIWAHVLWCMCGSQEKLQELVLSLHFVGSRN